MRTTRSDVTGAAAGDDHHVPSDHCVTRASQERLPQAVLGAGGIHEARLSRKATLRQVFVTVAAASCESQII